MGVVDDGGAWGDDEGGGFAGGVDAVALGNLVGVALGAAAGGADLFGGVDVVFEGAFGEYDGANVAAFHDEGADGLEGALGGDEGVADFEDGGDVGDSAIDGVAIEFFSG